MNLPAESDIRQALRQRHAEAEPELDLLREQLVASLPSTVRPRGVPVIHFVARHRLLVGALAACWALTLFFQVTSPPADLSPVILAKARQQNRPEHYTRALADYAQLLAWLDEELRRPAKPAEMPSPDEAPRPEPLPRNHST